MTAPFKWSAQKQKAVLLLAAVGGTVAGIAREVGVTDKSVYNWLAVPEFAEALSAERERVAAEVRRQVLTAGIADQVERIRSKDRRRSLLLQVIDERAEYAKAHPVDAPGWETGLLIHDCKTVAKTCFDVYTLDVSVLSELSRLETDVARELGQWVDRNEHTGKGGGPIRYSQEMSDDELEHIARGGRHRAVEAA